MPVPTNIRASLFVGLFLLCLNSALVFARECTKVVISADPSYPPLHWYDGQTFHGPSVAIATQVLHQMGVAYEVRYIGPLPRVLFTAKSGGIDMITTLKITPERLQDLAFTAQPAFSNPIAVFVMRAQAFPYHQWSDLREKQGGIARGNRFGEPFDAYADRTLQLQDAGDMEQNFKKLQFGRIDYFLTGYYSGMAYILSKHLQSRIEALQPFVISSDNYIAFAKNSPCLSLLPAFNRTMVSWLQRHSVHDLLEEGELEWAASPH